MGWCMCWNWNEGVYDKSRFSPSFLDLHFWRCHDGGSWRMHFVAQRVVVYVASAVMEA